MLKEIFRIVVSWTILIGTLFCISKYLTLNQFMVYISIGILFSILCFTLVHKRNKKLLESHSVYYQAFMFLILSFVYLPFTIIVLMNILLNILCNSKNE